MLLESGRTFEVPGSFSKLPRGSDLMGLGCGKGTGILLESSPGNSNV